MIGLTPPNIGHCLIGPPVVRTHLTAFPEQETTAKSATEQIFGSDVYRTRLANLIEVAKSIHQYLALRFQFNAYLQELLTATLFAALE